MKQVCGFWLPNEETHLIPFLERGPYFAGGPTYQLRKLIASVPYIVNFRHAVDIGAHCGLWARPLASMFGHVSAFEPVPIHRECLEENIIEYKIENISVYPFALGDKTQGVSLHSGQRDSSGGTFIQEGGEHKAEMRTLDSFELHDVDLIKIDVEGWEFSVILGSLNTIKRCKPIMIVEQKGNDKKNFGESRNSAVGYLRDVIGMIPMHEPISGDWIMGWPK